MNRIWSFSTTKDTEITKEGKDPDRIWRINLRALRALRGENLGSSAGTADSTSLLRVASAISVVKI